MGSPVPVVLGSLWVNSDRSVCPGHGRTLTRKKTHLLTARRCEDFHSRRSDTLPRSRWSSVEPLEAAVAASP